MIHLKNLLINAGYYTIFLILIVFIASFLNLFGVNSTITSLLLFLFNTGAFFFFGLKSGKKASKKGFLEGLKQSLILLFILFVLNLATSKGFSLSQIIYYIILILAGIIGGTTGINKKENK